MAVTEFGTNDPQTVKLWSKMTFREVLHKMWFRRLIGTGDQAIIRRETDLERSAGDTIKFDLLRQMTQEGVDGDNPIEGFEEKLTYEQDEVYIDQRRIAHAFRRMAQQRTVHGLRTDARANLADRFAELYDFIMFAQLAGKVGNLSNWTISAATAAHAGNTLQDPAPAGVNDTDHYRSVGAEMTTDVVDILVEKAQTIRPMCRPSVFEGSEHYVLIMHTRSVTDLRIATGSNLWREILAAAQIRGDKNPLFTGAMGMWNNVVLHSSPRVPVTTGSPDIAHSLFLGANAGVVAWGNAYSKLDQDGPMGGDNFMSWFERKSDYGNERGVAAGAIFGMKPAVFGAATNGTVRYGMIRHDVQAASNA